jgi:hypothetical protein
MQNYLQYLSECKQNLDQFNPSDLTNFLIDDDVPYNDFETALVMILMKDPRPTGEKMNTRNGKLVDLVFDEWTGRVYTGFRNYNGILMYVGRDIEDKRRYFYRSGQRDKGVFSFLEDVSTEVMESTYEFVIDSKIKLMPKKINLKFAIRGLKNARTPRKKKIYRILDKLNDCEIQCADGKVKANKWHLCMNNDFFYQYISKYSEPDGIFRLKDYSCQVFNQYIYYTLDPEVLDKQVVFQNLDEVLSLGMFLQDYKFVGHVYELVAPHCEEETLESLNMQIKDFFALKSQTKTIERNLFAL